MAMCSECVVETPDGPICKRCSDKVEASRQQSAADEVKAAKRRIIRNWVLSAILYAFVLMTLFASGEMGRNGLVQQIGIAAFALYAVWSTVWGVPVVVGWWRRMINEKLGGVGCAFVAGPMGWFILLFSIVLVGIHLGYLYGIFGGAIAQYRKNRRIAVGRP